MSPRKIEWLPQVPEEINALWLSNKIGRKIKSIDSFKADHGSASKLFYTVTLEQDGENAPETIKICVKGGFNPDFRKDWPEAKEWWISEARFFSNIANTLSFMEPPSSLWAGNDDDQGIVIMKDLAAEGCTFGHPAQPRTVADVFAGVEQLAGLHATTWACSDNDYPWLIGRPKYVDFLIQQAAKGYYEVFGEDMERPIPAKMRDQARMEAVLIKYKSLSNPRLRALVHGDSHIGNTYYKLDGSLRYLDWQLYHPGSIFHDISYFIASMLTVEDRRAHEKECVDHYLKTLVKLGKDRGVPSLSIDDEDVWTEYRKSFLSGTGWFITRYNMHTPEVVHAQIRLFAAAIEDHSVIELIESLPDVQ